MDPTNSGILPLEPPRLEKVATGAEDRDIERESNSPVAATAILSGTSSKPMKATQQSVIRGSPSPPRLSSDSSVPSTTTTTTTAAATTTTTATVATAVNTVVVTSKIPGPGNPVKATQQSVVRSGVPLQQPPSLHTASRRWAGQVIDPRKGHTTSSGSTARKIEVSVVLNTYVSCLLPTFFFYFWCY